MRRSALGAVLLVVALLAGCSDGDRDADETSCPLIWPPPPGCGEGWPAPSPAPVGHPAPHHPSGGRVRLEHIEVASVGGHTVPATVHKPVVAGPDAQVPILLHSHGWAGARQQEEDGFTPYVAAGFGVVSFDMRGHGDAADDSVARVHRMAYEIADVQAVIDQIASWDWVLLDGPGDPRIGAIGGSYGGGYQLLTAAVDDRLDAIAPRITWHDLLQSLAPDGAPKSVWIDLLYWGAAATQTRVADDIHQAYAWVQATNTVPDGSDPGEPDISTPLSASSPRSYPDAIDIPTLLIQGTSDTLFNLNEAAANHAQIAATGAPVRLATHLNGHIISTDGNIPFGTPEPVGLQPGAGPDPCGDPDDLAILWFQRHLLGLDVEPGVPVCLALEDGSTFNATTYPPPSTEHRAVDVPDMMLALRGAAATAEARVLEAERETVVAGIPRLTATVESPGPDAIVYWTLEVARTGGERHVVNAQVTPMRVAGDEEVDMELMGTGVRLAPGDRLMLVASDHSDQYLHNEGRVPAVVTMTDIELVLPILDPAAHVQAA